MTEQEFLKLPIYTQTKMVGLFHTQQRVRSQRKYIEDEIKSLQKSLTELQESCTHPSLAPGDLKCLDCRNPV